MLRNKLLVLCLFTAGINNLLVGQVCTATILQKDTVICYGTTLKLSVLITDSLNFCNTYSLSPSLQSGLLGWYPFCGNTNDISPNAENGFATGPLTYTSDRYNKPNTAIKFTGNGESVRTNKIDRTTSNSFSYVVWVNAQNTVALPQQTLNPSSGFYTDLATPCVIHATHGYNWNLNNQHTGAGLYIAGNGIFVVEHSNSIVATPLSWAGALNGWHSVAVVYDNHLPKLYVDGSFIKDGLITPYIVHPSAGCDSFYLNGVYPYITSGFGKGFKPGNVSVPFNNFKGDIDDIKIYQRALSASEVAELYSKDKLSIIWSTGDTSQNISVTPAVDTFYSVRVTNSLGVCNDTVHVFIQQCNVDPCAQSGILNNDTVVCKGLQLQLKAKTALSYAWYPLGGLNDSTIQNPIAQIDRSTVYYLNSKIISGNLVKNGDFEQGNTGFFTNYTNCTTNNCLFPLADNGYSVGTNANFFHTSFQGKDHTTGSGNFMIINGANPNLVVWRQTIAVTPNTDYAFGTWISTMIALNPASIRFSINGLQLGNTFAALLSPNQWVRYFTQWNSGNNNSAIIEIVDINPQANGNDFGLDDIFFGQITSCSDSIKISVSGTAYNALPDSMKVCGNAATLNAGPGFKLYNWNTGAATQIIPVNTSGLYKVTVSNADGCSFIDSCFVQLQSYATINTQVNICAGQTYTLVSGIKISAAGIYRDTLKSFAGCDSAIFITNLLVSSPSTITLNKTICDGQSYILHSGIKINSTGFYKDTIRSFSGCDSLITLLNLTIAKPVIINNAQSICEGQLYTLPSGVIINSAGDYSDTVKNISGCDSVISTIRLTLNLPSTSGDTVFICIGKSFILPSGLLVTEPGIYKRVIKNYRNCDSVITTTILNKAPLSIAISNTSEVCSGDNLTISAQASGGNGGPYSYTWSGSNNTSNQIIISPTATIKVVVSVTDGCTILPAKNSLVVSVKPKPTPGFTSNKNEGCIPLATNFINTTIPVSGNEYRWNFSDGGIALETSPTHLFNKTGNYTVSLFVTASNGCRDSVKINNAVKVYNQPIASFSVSPSPNSIGNSKFQFTNKSTYASSWLWLFGDGIGNSTQPNPSYIYKETGNFKVFLIATSDNYCTDTTYQNIEVKSLNGIYVPTAFSPNGDGKNDYFSIYGTGIQSAQMQIFNRFGELIFLTTNNPPAWDGRNSKTQAICVEGNYVYLIKVIDKNGIAQSFKGNIVLVK